MGKGCGVRTGAGRAALTQVVIVFLLALFGQGSALGVCKRPTVSPRGAKAAPRPTSTPWGQASPTSVPALGSGRTCELSLLGELGRAGAAGDTNE